MGGATTSAPIGRTTSAVAPFNVRFDRSSELGDLKGCHVSRAQKDLSAQSRPPRPLLGNGLLRSSPATMVTST